MILQPQKHILINPNTSNSSSAFIRVHPPTSAVKKHLISARWTNRILPRIARVSSITRIVSNKRHIPRSIHHPTLRRNNFLFFPPLGGGSDSFFLPPKGGVLIPSVSTHGNVDSALLSASLGLGGHSPTTRNSKLILLPFDAGICSN
jgi:hypothetical protein